MNVSKLITLVILIAAILFPASGQGQDSLMRTVLTNCNIIDCTGSPVQENMTIIITGNEISSIRQGEYRPSRQDENTEVIDLEGAYVLPGFWNMHTHLTDLLPWNNALTGENLVAKAIRGGLNALDGLRYGFTSLRSAGEEGYIDVTWRGVFDKGFFLGPRIFASGPAVSPTAGHRGSATNGADGVGEIRKAVRERILNGANVIKIMSLEMFPDELEAVVETAHSFGIRVLSHSREPGTYRDVATGVDCIEHGYRMTDETIKLMVEKGTFFDPTINANLSDEYIKEREAHLARLGHSGDEQIVRIRKAVTYADERTPEHALNQRQILKKAADAGVKLLIGADSMPIGEIGILEMEEFVNAGVSEMQTLIAATRNGADMLGVLDRLGTVEEGKLADLVVVADNPLDNISNIRKIKMVFKGGVSVDLEHPLGTTGYLDYFETSGFGRIKHIDQFFKSGGAEKDARFK
jgi:imidazolonepropionase-like amidohydrolase